MKGILRAITGADISSDRPIGGFDQTDFLLGNKAESACDHRLVFYQGHFSAIRWKHYKCAFRHFRSVQELVEDRAGPRSNSACLQPLCRSQGTDRYLRGFRRSTAVPTHGRAGRAISRKLRRAPEQRLRCNLTGQVRLLSSRRKMASCWRSRDPSTYVPSEEAVCAAGVLVTSSCHPIPFLIVVRSCKKSRRSIST